MEGVGYSKETLTHPHTLEKGLYGPEWTPSRPPSTVLVGSLEFLPRVLPGTLSSDGVLGEVFSNCTSRYYNPGPDSDPVEFLVRPVEWTNPCQES